MEVYARLNVTPEQIAGFCREHRIRRLAVFGSVLRDDFGPESDVDVLVEFEPDFKPGWEYYTLGADLERIVGRKVDLIPYRNVHPYLRHEIYGQARPLYDAA